MLLWCSIIHTPAGQARIFAELRRILRPGSHALVGFQSGEGTRDVSASYRRFGHEVELERHLYTADQVAEEAHAADLRERCRLVRRAGDDERSQAVLLVQAV